MNPYNGTNANGGAQTRAPRVKVTFELNIPQVVTLEFDPPAEPREGNWGPQYMYFCGENRIAFLDPPVHEQILALDAHAGDTLAIVKRKSGRANRWEVNRVEAGRVQPAPPRPAPEAARAPRETVRTPAKSTSPPPIREGHEHIAGNLMASALKQAIEACDLCEFAATHEDLRAMAISIYISATGGRQK